MNSKSDHAPGNFTRLVSWLTPWSRPRISTASTSLPSSSQVIDLTIMRDLPADVVEMPDRYQMTVLEKMARALCKIDGHPEDAVHAGEPRWRAYLSNARVTLASITLPTSEMCEAGATAARPGSDIDNIDAYLIWSRMVWAALGEYPDGKVVV